MIMRFLRTQCGKIIGNTAPIYWGGLTCAFICLFRLIGIHSKPMFFVMLTIGIGLMVFSMIYDFYVYTYIKVFPIPLFSNVNTTKVALVAVKGIGYGTSYGKKYRDTRSMITDHIWDVFHGNYEYIHSENIYSFAHKLEDFMEIHDMAKMLSSRIPSFYLEYVGVSMYDNNNELKHIMMIEWNTFTGERTSNWEIETRR